MALRLLASRLPTSLARPQATLAFSRLYSERRYTKDHEWVSVSGGVGTVGISDHAQTALGDVVFVELPAVGTKLEQKGNLGAVESVKAASEIYAPVSGEVVEKNSNLDTMPSLINESPYEKGWLVKVKLSNPNEVQSLFSEAQYKKYLEESH